MYEVEGCEQLLCVRAHGGERVGEAFVEEGGQGKVEVAVEGDA